MDPCWDFGARSTNLTCQTACLPHGVSRSICADEHRGAVDIKVSKDAEQNLYALKILRFFLLRS